MNLGDLESEEFIFHGTSGSLRYFTESSVKLFLQVFRPGLDEDYPCTCVCVCGVRHVSIR